MKKYFFQYMVCFCLVSVSCMLNKAQAQAVSIQGKITDSDKKPVHGVTVAEVDDEGRTIKADKTDIDGNFSLKVTNKKHKLSISHISFKSVTLNIGEQTVF
ncbi:MAG: carboxypeptidase regulatory-like domain-containing protein [Bacteroidota bacterium]